MIPGAVDEEYVMAGTRQMRADRPADRARAPDQDRLLAQVASLSLAEETL
jgi:hypothetical protein